MPSPVPAPSSKPHRHHRYIADGTHADVRWWLEGHPGAAHPVATVSGWTEGGYVIEQAELPGRDERTVRAYLEAVLACFEAQHARTAGQRKAPPIAT